VLVFLIAGLDSVRVLRVVPVAGWVCLADGPDSRDHDLGNRLDLSWNVDNDVFRSFERNHGSRLGFDWDWDLDLTLYVDLLGNLDGYFMVHKNGHGNFVLYLPSHRYLHLVSVVLLLWDLDGYRLSICLRNLISVRDHVGDIDRCVYGLFVLLLDLHFGGNVEC